MLRLARLKGRDESQPTALVAAPFVRVGSEVCPQPALRARNAELRAAFREHVERLHGPVL